MDATELNILVIEDDSFQRRIVVGMLRLLGVTSISEAGNGQQALDIIKSATSRPVHIAFCDLKMPGMDGMEFLRHLGEGTNKVAVVILSALDKKLLASVDRMARIYGIKLLGTISKPIALDHIKKLLAKHNDAPGPQRSPIPETQRFTIEEIIQGIRKKQFTPFLQPKVDFKTGRIVGAEALARWIHPELGVVGPADFIPLLEQSGNIDDLTFLMLHDATSACRMFLDNKIAITMSLNLSLASLDDPLLADKITLVVRNAGINPKLFVLEITESAAMTDIAQALENLARLCMNGFTLSIDDYGTGYSSMQQLTRIAFSELKIDRSFVTGLSDNEALRIIVESSIEMAHKLQIKSVAEGVETKADWETLRIMGCNIGQGYFIAKPMDLEAFQAFIARYN